MPTLISLVLMAASLFSGEAAHSQPSDEAKTSSRALVRSMRFDPGYLYAPEYKFTASSRESRATIIRQLVKHWQLLGIHRIYLLINNTEFGAYFNSQIGLQSTEGNLGHTPFFDELLNEMDRHGIEGWAWFYLLQNRQAFTQHADWRAPCPGPFPLLDVRKPEARAWYQSLIRETLERFPLLKGVDLSEPMSGTACKEDQSAAAPILNAYLSELAKEFTQKKKGLTLTPALSFRPDGSLLPNSEFIKSHGLDLEGALKQVPFTAVLPQILFQSWHVQSPLVFKPEWTGRALADFIKQFSPNCRVGVHLEWSPFSPGGPPIPASQLRKAFESALDVDKLYSIDVYDTHLSLKRLGEMF